jgi:hypothetical protein
MVDPAGALGTLIAGDSTLGFTTGTNLFLGPLRPVSTAGMPRQALFVLTRPSMPPTRVMSEATEIRGTAVELILRWSNYSGGRAKALAIMDFLLGQTPSGFLDTYTIQSEPLPQGPDNDNNHQFHIVYIMKYEQAAA